MAATAPSASPSELALLTAAAFDVGGALARHLPHFLPRDEQSQMAAAVADAIDAAGDASSDRLIVEAGTGVGKSFAYLAPLLQSGKRALVSTATKTLQDQLFFKDLPTVRAALGVSVDVALLKGRNNYICLYRLAHAEQEGRLPTRDSGTALRRVQWLAKATQTGDRAELSDVPDDHAIWPLVTSTKDNCLGANCPDYAACFVMKARRRALAADITVVNHHLFFADASLRDSGMGELLPSADVMVFDEAHQITDIGVQFAGVNLSTHQLVELSRDALAAGITQARGLTDWSGFAAGLQQFCRELRLAFGQQNGRIGWADVASAVDAYSDEKSHHDIATEWIVKFEQQCSQAALLLAQFTEISPELARLHERASELAQECVALRNEAKYAVRYVEIGNHTVRFRASPLSIAESFGAWARDFPGSVIFTSATLADTGTAAKKGPQAGRVFSQFEAASGVIGAKQLCLASPFDYAAQGRLYLPKRFMPPNSEGFDVAVAEQLIPMIKANPGGTLVLCTSLRAMRSVAQLLQDADTGAEIIVQDRISKREALQIMLKRRAVLIGSHSFWEGVDLPGNAVNLVAIDKLPFASPDDPVLQARFAEAKKNGGSGFKDVSLPQAALLLKQGAGRLIRSASDRGVLAIFDARLRSASYGATLLAAVPNFTQLDSLGEACDFLRTL